MRISDWSADVCSSDLKVWLPIASRRNDQGPYLARQWQFCVLCRIAPIAPRRVRLPLCLLRRRNLLAVQSIWRSEEHTSELQSLMRISYAVFCLKKKNHTKSTTIAIQLYTYETNNKLLLHTHYTN